MVKSYRNSRSLNNRRKRNTRRTKGGGFSNQSEVNSLFLDLLELHGNPTEERHLNIKSRLQHLLSNLKLERNDPGFRNMSLREKAELNNMIQRLETASRQVATFNRRPRRSTRRSRSGS
jgi:hypothetical protein